MADSILKAVSPDNLKTPTGLQINTEKVGAKVVTEICCDSKLSTFTATIDDLLFSASTAEKAIEIINKPQA